MVCLILKNIKKIKIKNCLIDEFGFSNLKGNYFESNYNYYKHNNKIIIRVEASRNYSIIPSIDYLVNIQ